MKKQSIKIISLMFVLSIVTIALFSCVKLPPQKSLELTSWGLKKETFTYKVESKMKDKTIKGTYKVTIDRLNKATIKVGEKEFKNFSGSIIKENLNMDDGSTKDVTTLISVNNSPYYSEVKIDFKNPKEYKHTIIADYSSKDKYVIVNKDGKKEEIKTGKFEKSFFFDNSSIFQILRSVDSSALKNGLSFKTLDYTSSRMKGLNARATKLEKPIKIDEKYKVPAEYNEINYIVNLNQQEKKPSQGLPILFNIKTDIKLKYIKDGKEVDYKVNYPIVQIQEGNTSYILDNVSIS